MTVKRYILAMCLSGSCLLAPQMAAAANGNGNGNQMCSDELLMSFFPREFVELTLDRFNVPQAQRSGIINDLAQKDSEVVPLVEDKAAKMNPNPLTDPQYRQEAVKIFRDTLYEVFAASMQAHGINDRNQIMNMLDDIQQQKAKRFAECMEQFEKEPPSPPPAEEKQQESPKENPNFSRQQRAPNSDRSSYRSPYSRIN